MKRTILLLAAASLFTAGCLHPHLALSKKPVVMAGAPKATADMDWHFAPQGDDAALTYGAVKGGDVKLALACTHKSGAVNVSRPVADLPEGAKSLVLVSGSVKTTDAGEVQASGDQQVLAVKFNTMSPIVQAFDERGWISVPNGSDRLVHMVPHAGNRAVHEFFAFCG
jgi:hypothetical protein